jgi:hypothetical protein
MAKKKASLPKKVAGIRIPKGIRKSRMIRAMLKNPVGRDLLANALVAGAGAAAAVLIEKPELASGAGKEVAKATKQGAKKSYRAAQIAGRALESGVSAMMGVVADAAHTLLPGKPKKARTSSKTAH